MDTIRRLVAGTIIVTAALAIAACGREERTVEGPGSQPARAFVPLTTAQAARSAQRIAIVVSHGSRVVEGLPDTPFTRTRFTVQELLKGRLGHSFVLQVIGGRLGNRFATSLLPPFVKARRYVLFLGPDGRAGPTIYPQSVIELGRPGGPRLPDVRASIQRSLSTEGSP